jgi:hypothetical protein
MFKYKTWGLRLLVSNNIKQLHDIRPATEILQYLYLPLDLNFFSNKTVDLDLF